MTILHKAMKGFRCLMALGYSVDDKFRSSKDITAHKDVALSCLISILLCLRVVSSVELHILSFQEASPLYFLTDSEDYFCSWKCDSLLFIILRVKLSFTVENRSAALEDDTNNLSILFNYFLWTPTTLDLDTVFPCFSYFKFRSGHDVFCLQREHCDSLRTATFTDAGCIDSYVTASDDNCFIRERKLSSVGSMQEIDGRLSAFSSFALDSRVSSTLASDGDIERLISFFSEIGECDVFSDFDSSLNLHTHLSHNLDFSVYYIFFKFVRRNTVSKHTSRNLIFLKYSWVISHLS